MTEQVQIDRIRMDGGTQTRAALSEDVIEDYADKMNDGISFPPVVVFYDGKDYWLADGFHRVRAAMSIMLDEIDCDVRQGTRRDAVWYSMGANKDHGFRRTRNDNQRILTLIFADDEWKERSLREIARHTGIPETTVRRHYEILSAPMAQIEKPAERTVTRNGSTYVMNTAKIGSSPSSDIAFHEPPLGHDTPEDDDAWGESWDDLILDDPADLIDTVAAPSPEYHPVVETPAMPASVPPTHTPMELFEPPTIAVPTPAPIAPRAVPSFGDTFSVEQWLALSETERQDVLDNADQSKPRGWNQTNDNVEWALWTWNPITGCKHNCAYCYARDIAQRFYQHLDSYDDRFTPVFYPDRLHSPSICKKPDLSSVTDPVRRMGLGNVFVCSMADLFGKWVPTDWIEAVLDQARANPQWNFLFLTKFPIRMAEFTYPKNTWIGTTVDTQYAVERAEKAFRKVRETGYEGVAWLSCEPMLERLEFTSLDMFDWVVMGGASESTQTPASDVDPRWAASLLMQAEKYDIPVYQKTNLVQHQGKPVAFDARIREYPAGVL